MRRSTPPGGQPRNNSSSKREQLDIASAARRRRSLSSLRFSSARSGAWQSHRECAGSPFLTFAMSLYAGGATPQTVSPAGVFADSPRGRWGYPDNLRPTIFAC